MFAKSEYQQLNEKLDKIIKLLEVPTQGLEKHKEMWEELEKTFRKGMVLNDWLKSQGYTVMKRIERDIPPTRKLYEYKTLWENLLIYCKNRMYTYSFVVVMMNKIEAKKENKDD